MGRLMSPSTSNKPTVDISQGKISSAQKTIESNHRRGMSGSKNQRNTIKLNVGSELSSQRDKPLSSKGSQK
jgi:hypothetical protein